ncbi:MAG: hypothetical protein FWB91_00970 [Defluviitaleaceae bacterium]|nr:hypothetical protein [Defluviitaleaceae bacterium]
MKIKLDHLGQFCSAVNSEKNPGYIQGKISEMERMMRLGQFVPLFIKKWIIAHAGHNVSAGCST